MPEIAIATMVGQNQGNRLQNYALQTVIERMTGARVETLRTCYGPSASNRAAKTVLRHVMPRKRWARFASFDARYIRFSPYRMDDPCLDSKYAFCFIGSDQVWNPTFDITGDVEYLPQVSSRKKASYAASFGVDVIAKDARRISQLLEDIPNISVREESGQHIVRQLTGREARLVLDPTLLLSSDDWMMVARKPALPVRQGEYQLVYALGKDLPCHQRRSLELVDLSDRSLPVGPAEFVWLILHAAYVCTDSYHATVLSLLMHTPFITYERRSHHQSMASRFGTLQRYFGFSGANDKHCHVVMSGELGDWSRFDQQLDTHRERSAAFLREVLHDARLI